MVFGSRGRWRGRWRRREPEAARASLLGARGERGAGVASEVASAEEEGDFASGVGQACSDVAL